MCGSHIDIKSILSFCIVIQHLNVLLLLIGSWIYSLIYRYNIEVPGGGFLMQQMNSPVSALSAAFETIFTL